MARGAIHLPKVIIEPSLRMSCSLVELFETQVERIPERIALSCGAHRIPYDELNRQANRLARKLLAARVETGDIVGVCMDRSLGYIAAILAVLKTGCAFLPLDLRYPPARLNFMLRDSGAAALLTTSRSAARFSNPPRTILLDAPVDTGEGRDGDLPQIRTQPTTPAYAVYTSGSTGKPKGILCPQAGLVHRLIWMWQQFPYQADEAACQIISPGFVDSIYEIFCPLLAGVEIAILPDEIARGAPMELMRAFSRHGITRAITVPSVLSYWLDAVAILDPELSPLRYCFVSGEVLLSPLARRFHEVLPHVRLINFYGASELSQHATWCEVTKSLAESSEKSIPIGRPIPHTQAHLLDSAMQPVPAGTPGELHMGGPGLAAGYLNLPDLTAERFVANPFEAGARLFKTGDLGRELPDGGLEYLGRMDQQIKIRGCRVEPAEVESAMKAHPNIQEAVAAGREDERGEQQLVAWVVPRQAGAMTSSDLRSFLKENLPDYAVPSRFAFLAALPRLPNNKVNRRELPDPGRFRWERKTAGARPRAGLEQRVAMIWEQLLGVPPESVEDDFFELGGHSLLAAQMIERIAAELGSDVPPALFLESPTIAQVVRAIEGEACPAYPRHILPIQPLGSKAPWLCFGAEAAFRDLARALGWDQPLFGVTPEVGDLEWLARGTSLQEIVRGLLHSVRALQSAGPYYLGGHSRYGLFAYEAARQLAAQGQEIGAVIMLDTFLPFAARNSCSVWARLGAHSAALLDRTLRGDLRAISKHVSTLAPMGWEVARRLFNQSRTDGSAETRQPAEARAAEILESLLNAAERAYFPGGYRGPVTLIEAGNQLLGPEVGTRFGWKTFCAGALDIRTVPGDHNSILMPPNVSELAREVQAVLGGRGTFATREN